MRRTNIFRIGLCACLCAAGAVGATELRKCEGKGGNSYVSGACPPGTREVWTRSVEPEPAPAVDKKRETKQRTAARSRTSAGRGQRSRSAAQSAGPASCEAAKRRRDDFRDRHWYTITYEQLSALDQRVARACR